MTRSDYTNYKSLKGHVIIGTSADGGTTWVWDEEALASRLTVRMNRREVTYDAIKDAPLFIEPGIKEYTGRLETGWIDFSFNTYIDTPTTLEFYFYDDADNTFAKYIKDVTLTSVEDSVEAGAFRKETVEFRFLSLSDTP